MGDWIRIGQIRLYGYHGVFAEEQEKGQTFEVDVELCMDLKQAGNSDCLESTIDYVEVYRVVEQVVTGKPKQLIEALAEHIARDLLKAFSIQQVIIRVRKPQVQMPGPFGTVEVEITRP